jgi:hypothetical protein
MNITIFGSCRLDSLNHYNNRIKNEISYTYDTKEILEVIKFIKYNHISPTETITTFRSPMINKNPIYASNFEGIFEKTDIFIIEICGKKTYKYNNFFVHSALRHYSSDLISQQIIINEQSNEEIENDILEIIYELGTKKIIIVSHIVTDDKSERYKLSKLLEDICFKYNLLFINPVVEIQKKGYNINDLLEDNCKKIIHYNEAGHKVMKEIYEEYINIFYDKL